MAKYIELIDKYRIEQSDGGDYNPPSYIWTDNTGEIIRCCDCQKRRTMSCPFGITVFDAPNDMDYCSRGERRDG